jgi:hypothetical protein
MKRYRNLDGRHLAVPYAAETIELKAETMQSRIRIAVAARTRSSSTAGQSWAADG